MSRPVEDPQVRFDRRVHVDGSGCWIWTGSPRPDGYGQFNAGDGEIVRSHVYAWGIANGRKVAPGMWILHHCDMRLCVNPAHLYEGTPLDNARDRVVRNRQARGERLSAILKEKVARGEGHYRSRFTDEQVAEMARMRASGVPYGEIGRRMGCPEGRRARGALVHGVLSRRAKHLFKDPSGPRAA